MQKFAKCRAMTSAFGGSIPGGRAGVFRRKTREKRRKCWWQSAAVFETEREARECGGLGAQPPRKVRRVERLCCVVRGACVRVVATAWCALWLFVACARTPFVLCTSPPRPTPRRERSDRRLGALLDAVRPDPKGSPEPQQKHGCGRARWHSTQFASTTGPQFLAFFKP